jgi:cell division septum initiation protein DivIVA
MNDAIPTNVDVVAEDDVDLSFLDDVDTHIEEPKQDNVKKKEINDPFYMGSTSD